MTRDLRRLRIEQRLTLAQVASAAGLSKGFLSKIERGEGNPTTRKIERIAQVLSVTPSAIWPTPMTASVSSAPSSLVWPDDDVVQDRIRRAWEGIRQCSRIHLKARTRDEHIPARRFQALTKIYAGEFIGPVTPADVESELALKGKALYRELDELEHDLLIQRTRRGRHISLEIGPVGYVWVNEEQGLAEDLSPFDGDVFLRFWTKSCSWLASGAMLAGMAASPPDDRADPRISLMQKRFETMLRRGAENPTRAPAAAAAILQIVPRDPLNVAVETRRRLARFLTELNTLLVTPTRRAEFEAELEGVAGATKIAAGLGLRELSLSPMVFAMLRIWVRGALHQLELIC